MASHPRSLRAPGEPPSPTGEWTIVPVQRNPIRYPLPWGVHGGRCPRPRRYTPWTKDGSPHPPRRQSASGQDSSYPLWAHYTRTGGDGQMSAGDSRRKRGWPRQVVVRSRSYETIRRGGRTFLSVFLRPSRGYCRRARCRKRRGPSPPLRCYGLGCEGVQVLHGRHNDRIGWLGMESHLASAQSRLRGEVSLFLLAVAIVIPLLPAVAGLGSVSGRHRIP